MLNKSVNLCLKLTELEGGYNKTRLKRHPVGWWEWLV